MNAPFPVGRGHQTAPRPGRQATAGRAAAVTAAGALGLALARKPWLRSGATAHEAAARLVGDELLPRAMVQATRGITFARPAAAVWPWLAQMGNGRGGWYSYDGVDNGGRTSLRHLDPALQGLQVGDTISDATGPFSFEVAVLHPGRALVLRACIHPITGRPVPPGLADPSAEGYAAAFLHLTWAFVLIPQGGTTRLLVRIRYLHSRGTWVRAMVHGFEVVDAVFVRRMFRGLLERIEVTSAPGIVHPTGPTATAGALTPGRWVAVPAPAGVS